MDFKASWELWNPLSKAIPGKFHWSGRHINHNFLQDQPNFHRSEAWQIIFILTQSADDIMFWGKDTQHSSPVWRKTMWSVFFTSTINITTITSVTNRQHNLKQSGSYCCHQLEDLMLIAAWHQSIWHWMNSTLSISFLKSLIFIHQLMVELMSQNDIWQQLHVCFSIIIMWAYDTSLMSTTSIILCILHP